ncbi:hypothetical protein ABT304_25285 [Nocardioides sp. NPDC000445]|uniref:hypothetical protein n=1 Tax=Nocardioides sp. NPDC000445 TaxID=3154257 RepID=UPI00331659F3
MRVKSAKQAKQAAVDEKKRAASEDRALDLGVGNLVAIAASVLVGGCVAAATVVGVVSSSTTGTGFNPPTVSYKVVDLTVDDLGYVPVELESNATPPRSWACSPPTASGERKCFVPIGNHESLTTQDVQKIVDDQLNDFRRESDAAAKTRPIVVKVPSDEGLDWKFWLPYGLAVVTFIWAVFTQRDHVRAGYKMVRGRLASLLSRLRSRLRPSQSTPES